MLSSLGFWGWEFTWGGSSLKVVFFWFEVRCGGFLDVFRVGGCRVFRGFRVDPWLLGDLVLCVSNVSLCVCVCVCACECLFVCLFVWLVVCLFLCFLLFLFFCFFFFLGGGVGFGVGFWRG